MKAFAAFVMASAVALYLYSFLYGLSMFSVVSLQAKRSNGEQVAICEESSQARAKLNSHEALFGIRRDHMKVNCTSFEFAQCIGCLISTCLGELFLQEYS